MKTVLISGSSGLIGSAVIRALNPQGYYFRRLVRPPRKPGKPYNAPPGSTVLWNPAEQQIEAERLHGHQVVIHLAGERVVGRWTDKKRQAIRESRVQGTQLLSESLAELPDPPRVLIQASAVGYYGDRGDEILDETAEPGEGLLPEVARQWEAASAAARQRGIRVVKLRIGVVLSNRGGALPSMAIPFRFGLGGVIGSGRQYMPWVSLDDVVGMIQWAIEDDRVEGPINVVAPQQTTNWDFTLAMGRAVKRPTILPLPAFVVRTVFGQMGEELMLASTRAVPKKAEALGYPFRDPQLQPTLNRLLR